MDWRAWLLLMLFALLAGAATALSPVRAADPARRARRRRDRGPPPPARDRGRPRRSRSPSRVALVYVIDALGLPDDIQRTIAIVVLFGFGVAMLVPALGDRVEALREPVAPGPARIRGEGSARACCSAPASGWSTRPAPGRSSPA